METTNWKSIGGREIYDTLPTELREEMKLYWRNNTKIKQLDKKKDKLLIQLKVIRDELKTLKKHQTKSLPNIRYVNKNFIPTISFSLDKRNTIPSLICVLKIKGISKSIYCGKIEDVKKKLSKTLKEDCNDYSFNKLKFVLRDIVSKVIMSFIDITNINKVFYEGSDIRFDNILKKYKTL
jgi:hypothetical protein